MSPAKHRPAGPINAEPEQVFAEHQDHGRKSGEKGSQWHGRIRTKISENEVNLMHLTGLRVIENRIRKKCPAIVSFSQTGQCLTLGRLLRAV
jgi:hypothetical protein